MLQNCNKRLSSYTNCCFFRWQRLRWTARYSWITGSSASDWIHAGAS